MAAPAPPVDQLLKDVADQLRAEATSAAAATTTENAELKRDVLRELVLEVEDIRGRYRAIT
jgi:hypothetical protein